MKFIASPFFLGKQELIRWADSIRRESGLSIDLHSPTTPLSLALCLSALTMCEIRLVITPLDPGYKGEALLNRIRMQG